MSEPNTVTETDTAKGAKGADGTAQDRPKQGFRFRAAFIPLAIFLLLAVMFGAALVSGDPSKVPSALIGKPAPDVALEPLEGLTRSGAAVPSFGAADLTGDHVSVVNFWASWCVPCRQEHPLLNTLARRPDVKVFGVNYKDGGGGGLNFLRELGNPFTAVGVDPNGRAAIEWGVYGMPETFIVGRDGTIVYKHVGPISRSDLEDTFIPEIEKAASR